MAFFSAVAIALAVAQGSNSPINDIPAKYRPTAPAHGAVVARVNGYEIKTEDVEAMLWDWHGFDAIQDLIAYQLVRAEAEKQRINVSEQEVMTSMDAGLKQMEASLKPGQTIEGLLLETGFTKSRLYLRYRTDALLNAMVERSYDPKMLIKVSTLVFRPDNELATALAQAINKADAAYNRLQKGESWEAVLKSTSTNDQILKTKGLLGWRELSAFPAAVRAELVKLKAGGVTHPAQTENGIQIFRLEVAGKDASPEERIEMKSVYVKSSRAPLLNRLRKEANIERLYRAIPGTNSQKDGN